MFIRVKRRPRNNFTAETYGYEYRNFKTLPETPTIEVAPRGTITALLLLEGASGGYLLQQDGISRLHLE